MRKFYIALFKYKKLLLFLYLVSILFSVYKVSRITYDFNIENYFPQDNPVRTKYDEFRKVIEHDDDKVILYLYREDQRDMIQGRILEELSTLEKKLTDSGFFSRVTSINSLKISYTEGEILNFKTVRELIEAGTDISVIRERIAASTVMIDNVISSDLKCILVVLKLESRYNDDLGREAMRKALDLLVGPASAVDYKILKSGIPYIRAQYVDLIKKEQMKFMPAALVMLFLILSWIFGNLYFVLFTFSIISISSLWTLCFMAINQVPITIFTSVIPLILLVIGITDSIHVLCVLRSKKGEITEHRLAEVFSVMYIPCFLTSITTFAGFLGLLSAGVRMVNQFALYTALGVMFSYFNTIVLLPLLLQIRKGYSFRNSTRNTWIRTLLLSLFSALRKHRTLLRMIFIVLHVVVIAGIMFLQVEGYVFDDLSKTCSVSRDIEKASSLHKGLVPLNIFFKAKDEGILFENDKLQMISRIEDLLKDEKEITNRVSVVSYLKEIAFKLEGMEQLPEDEDRIRNYINVYLCDNSKFALELVSEDFSAGQIKCRVRDMGSNRFEGFLNRLKKKTEFKNEYLQVDVTGLSTVVQEVYRYLVWGILKSTLITVLAITFMFIVVFRSPSMVTLAVLVNLFPLMYAAGIMGWSGIRVNLSVIVIFSIAFGLVVDDTIHLLYKYIHHRKQRPDFKTSTAVLRMMMFCGKGVIFTSIVIMTGFSLMCFSVFSLQYYMGSLLSLIVFIALVFDLVYLPLKLLKK